MERLKESFEHCLSPKDCVNRDVEFAASQVEVLRVRGCLAFAKQPLRSGCAQDDSGTSATGTDTVWEELLVCQE